jgi:UDP-N-acetylmuramate dehydrogenase
MFREQVDLQPYNTLALHARAAYFCEAGNKDELLDALAMAREKNLPVLPLGEGSNIVLTRDFPGLVLRQLDHSVHVEYEDDSIVHVRVGAGMGWHHWVEKSLSEHWYGLENLALIPGTVGAAPVQNIGAYGVELSRFVLSVSAIRISTGEMLLLDNAACRFSYRNSIFKGEFAQDCVITSVVFSLSKQARVNADYAALIAYFSSHAVEFLTPQVVKDAVCAVRRERLPDPRVLPNVGSFFKNPQISGEQFASLHRDYPDIAHYTGEDGRIKIAAAWLIDQLGWKGRCMGAACVHDRQALVLVNRHGASGVDILALADAIRVDVNRHFGIQLEREPWVW